jgi:hypothetical protein
MIFGVFSFYLFQYEFYLYLEKSQITVMGNITSENPTPYLRQAHKSVSACIRKVL